MEEHYALGVEQTDLQCLLVITVLNLVLEIRVTGTATLTLSFIASLQSGALA